MNINAVIPSKSYDFYLKNAYSSNRTARKAPARLSLGKNDLVMADSAALKKVSEKLRMMEYSSDTGEEIYTNIKLFIDTYNNLMDSSDSSTSSEISRARKLMENLTTKEKEELEEIGITVSSDNKLKLKKETLLECTPDKIRKVFSQDNSFTQSIKFYAGKINRSSRYINISSSGINLRQSTPASSSKSIDITL